MEMNEELLAKLEKNSRQQLLFTKILCGLCAVVLICSVVLAGAVAGAASQLTEIVAPLQDVAGQIQDVAGQIQEIAGEVQDMTGQAETIMDNMETVTQALADADLGTMVENVNALTEESQTVVAEALGKLDTIDIDTLNKAIQDLSDVVEPLAKLSRIW